MNVTREVILDLLPLYVAGEASAATRALVDEFLKQDPELQGRVRRMTEDTLGREAPFALPADLEVKSLQKTRRMLAVQRWVFGFALGFSAIAFSCEFTTSRGRIQEFHFLMKDYPVAFGISLALGAVFWIVHLQLRRRLRLTSS